MKKNEITLKLTPLTRLTINESNNKHICLEEPTNIMDIKFYIEIVTSSINDINLKIYLKGRDASFEIGRSIKITNKKKLISLKEIIEKGNSLHAINFIIDFIIFEPDSSTNIKVVM